MLPSTNVFEELFLLLEWTVLEQLSAGVSRQLYHASRFFLEVTIVIILLKCALKKVPRDARSSCLHLLSSPYTGILWMHLMSENII